MAGKVLIFGISGFVGNYLAKEFLTHGYVVCGSDIAEKGNLSPDVRFRRADLLDAQAVEQLVGEEAPDMIVNLAAVSSVGQSWEIPQMTMSVNVIGALNILEASRKCGWSPKILFVGSSEEYQASDRPIDEQAALNANNPYGISKMTQECYAELYRERYALKVYCVRSFNHTGVGQRDTFVLPSFCKQAAGIHCSGQPGVIRVGNLAAERDFSNVKDVVRGYRMVLESSDCTQIYNIGSGYAYSIREILDYIISLTPQKITVETEAARFRPVDTPRICCDHQLITANLGWEPEYDIFATVKEMFEHYVTHMSDGGLYI